ncbi:Wzy polymerase domain-containing protein [Klebsiella pneumoniae]|uniref:O-Antigen ligase n=1 Tax=Klebsiella pneumoniae TaxID=573 RepID=A0A8D6PZU7_KLEPN|nr:Wzy polymerase domain-containing protein [Klebsiella pneumoniae]AYO66278.1 hypothetical protein DA795_04245 [Klebsiella pneumoniae]MBM4741145.1 hypothetical protein [Klebsiella pneumoniae]MCM5920543.1 Wzy polymerase domain-containing protein [Klebsiella pneumoniae]MDZ0673603.1 Wzy polymerase domain-containing protein [Klebsiella pneumoniae]NWL97934.1 hypothetical protein [Klebsiella pneumoniae]
MRRYYLFLFPVILLCALPLYPWPSLPGSGLTVTINLLTCFVAGLWGLGLCFSLPWRRLRFGAAGRMLFIGLILLNLPGLWTPAPFRSEAIYRLAATAGFAFLLWMLLQLPVRGDQRRGIYGIVVVAALIQALLCLWQALLPLSAAHWLHYNPLVSGGRATGAFGQANLLGSFLACGMLCALWLSVTIRRKAISYLLLGCVVVLCVALMLSESRTAWLGAAAGLFLLLWSADRSRSRILIIMVLGAGLLAGHGARMLRPTILPVTASLAAGSAVQTPSTRNQPAKVEDRLSEDRHASNKERVALIRGAWAMIVKDPLWGQGTGTFETAFPVALNQLGVANPFPVTVAHPHNEVLYAWVEGGSVALVGLICWLMLWALPFRFPRRGLARGAFSLPLMAHVMTEYPFYLSALHGVLMVVLLWLALPVSARRCDFPCRHRKSVRAVLALGCMGCIAFMFTGLQSAWLIRKAEASGFVTPEPLAQVWNIYAQPERLQFDWAVTDLMQFNQTQDPRWLARFQRNAGDWLTRHNDPNLTETMIRIAAVQQKRALAEAWRQRGCLSYRTDQRFHCGTASFFQPESFR